MYLNCYKTNKRGGYDHLLKFKNYEQTKSFKFEKERYTF